MVTLKRKLMEINLKFAASESYVSNMNASLVSLYDEECEVNLTGSNARNLANDMRAVGVLACELRARLEELAETLNEYDLGLRDENDNIYDYESIMILAESAGEIEDIFDNQLND